MSASVFAAAEAEANRVRACGACGKPIAFSTCEGSSVPDEQADPDDTAMPSRSSAMSSDSDSTRSKLMLVVFGTRGAAVAVDGRCRARARARRASSRSRSAAMRGAASAASSAARTSAATPMPASAGTFSVPARRLRSCRPPVTNGSEPHAAPHPQRAGALGPAELVRRQSTAGRRPAPARRPAACRPSAPRRCGRARRGCAPARPVRRSAAPCRSRCWRASPTRRRCVGERRGAGRRARRCRAGRRAAGSRRQPRLASAFMVLQHGFVLDARRDRGAAGRWPRAPRPRRGWRRCRSRCRRR